MSMVFEVSAHRQSSFAVAVRRLEAQDPSSPRQWSRRSQASQSKPSADIATAAGRIEALTTSCWNTIESIFKDFHSPQRTLGTNLNQKTLALRTLCRCWRLDSVELRSSIDVGA